jgi:hypothetical protein
MRAVTKELMTERRATILKATMIDIKKSAE